MKRKLLMTFDVLNRLNNLCRDKILSQAELEEQKSNFEEIEIINSELQEILSKLENSTTLSVDETVESLLQLHLRYSDYIWHIDQIHELVKKMAGNYRHSF